MSVEIAKSIEQRLVEDLSSPSSAFIAGASFRSLVASLPLGVLIVHGETIVYANVLAHQIFGYSYIGELAGQKVEVLIPEALRTKHRGHMTRYLDDPIARTMGSGLPLAGVTRRGDAISLEIALSPLRVQEINCVVAVVKRL